MIRKDPTADTTSVTEEGVERPLEAWNVESVACFYDFTVELVDMGTYTLNLT